jgi:hypothetical protein
MVLLGYFLAASLLRVQEGLRYVFFALTLVFLAGTALYTRRLLSRKDVLDGLAE